MKNYRILLTYGACAHVKADNRDHAIEVYKRDFEQGDYEILGVLDINA